MKSSKVRQFATKRVYKGLKLDENGSVTSEYFADSQVFKFMKAEVSWKGQLGRLHFGNFQRGFLVNEEASRLITHTGFVIRGPAYVEFAQDRWHRLIVMGDEKHVRESVENLTLKDPPVIYGATSVGWTQRQNVLVSNENDALAVKLAF